jgi:hypothetical protein
MFFKGYLIKAMIGTHKCVIICRLEDESSIYVNCDRLFFALRKYICILHYSPFVLYINGENCTVSFVRSVLQIPLRFFVRVIICIFINS